MLTIGSWFNANHLLVELVVENMLVKIRSGVPLEREFVTAEHPQHEGVALGRYHSC